MKSSCFFLVTCIPFDIAIWDEVPFENILKRSKVKLFACGPNAMLRVLKEFCIVNDLDCEVSTECAMACGFGICQGCPIESTERKEKYYLVCKDGPVFNIKDIVI